MTTRETGRAAETQARAHLEKQGLRCISQNWSCRLGELDLIMLDGDTLVFVEVRARTHHAWGGALESVDARKRQRLINAATHFLQQDARWNNYPCRFDIVAIDRRPGSAEPMNWIANAFDS